MGRQTGISRRSLDRDRLPPRLAPLVLLLAVLPFLVACTDSTSEDFSATSATARSTSTPTATAPAAIESSATSASGTAPTDPADIELQPITVEEAPAPAGLTIVVASDLARPVSERRPTRIDRVTFAADGTAQTELLLEAAELGWDRFLSLAATADGQTIVVSQCSRGDCALMGTQPSDDAQTTLVRSTDGGAGWREWTVLDGAYSAVGFLDGELLLSRFVGVDAVPQGDRARREFSLYPSGDAVPEPAGSAGFLPIAPRGSGDLLWHSEEAGVLLHSDGSVAVAFDLSRWQETEGVGTVVQRDDGTWLAEVFSSGECRPAGASYRGCLAHYGAGGDLLALYDAPRVFLPVVAPGGVIVLTAIEPQRGAPPSAPAYLDIEGGALRVIAHPFLDAPWTERDHLELLSASG